MKKVVSFQQLKRKDVICRATYYSVQVLEFIMVHPRLPEYYVFLNSDRPLEFEVLHQTEVDMGYYFYTNYAELLGLEIDEMTKRLKEIKRVKSKREKVKII